MMRCSSILLLLVLTHGVLISTKPINPAVDENGELHSASYPIKLIPYLNKEDQYRRENLLLSNPSAGGAEEHEIDRDEAHVPAKWNSVSGFESHVHVAGDSPVASLLLVRSPTKETDSGPVKGGSSKSLGLDRKGLASLVVSTAGSWRVEQQLSRAQQHLSAKRAGEANSKGEQAAKHALNVLLEGPQEEQSWEDHGKHVDSLEETVNGPKRARDRHYMRLLKEYEIEKKRGADIDRIAKKLPVIKQRLNKLLPMGAPSTSLKLLLEKAKETNAKHEIQRLIKGVYLPPRRGKGGMDNKGGIIDYKRDLTPPNLMRGGKGAGRAVLGGKETGDSRKESSARGRAKQVIKIDNRASKKGSKRPSGL